MAVGTILSTRTPSDCAQTSLKPAQMCPFDSLPATSPVSNWVGTRIGGGGEGTLARMRTRSQVASLSTCKVWPKEKGKPYACGPVSQESTLNS